MAAAAKRIEVSGPDRAELERIVRSRTAEQRMVERATIVLAAGEGESAARIAERVGCSEQTVLRWRGRYEQYGLAGLQDLERPGRPPVHGREVRARLLALAASGPPEAPRGPRPNRWTYRELAERVGMSESQVHAILRAADIRPH
jgi:transposase